MATKRALQPAERYMANTSETQKSENLSPTSENLDPENK